MPKRTLQTAGIWIGLACYWLALFVATHLPKELVPVSSVIFDKVPHFVAYALLAIFVAAAWRVTKWPLSLRGLCTVWIALLLYGAIDEMTQIPVGRHASFGDWLADAAGAAVGLAIFRACFRRRKISAHKSSDSIS